MTNVITAGLTESQFATYEYIRGFINRQGYSPTTAEITEGLGLRSRSAVHRNLQAISRTGLIELLPNRRRNIRLTQQASNDALLPLVGKIAAGQPIEAVEQEERVDINSLLAGKDRYLLEVKGDSMIGDNICDGDYVVCEKSQLVRNGQIAVVLVKNREATLKRVIFDKERDSVTLLPSNPNLQPMELSSHDVKIQGIYLGLLRLGNLRLRQVA